MKPALQKTLISTLLAFCIALALVPGALAAAPTLVTTTGVNLRSGASTGSDVVRTVGEGVSVEVLSHDPAGWSKVRVSGSEGYIRSDLLAVPPGSSATFKTTSGVNLRSGPSADADRIRGISADVSVEVVQHDPDPADGWSKVRYENSEGYVKSEFLALVVQGSQQAGNGSGSASASTSASVSSEPVILRTNTAARLRSGPSTDREVIRVLALGTSVEVVEQSKNGWTKVRHNGTEGYIRSDLLGVGNSKVELITMSQVRDVIKSGDRIQILDIRTGITFTIRAFSVGRHADSEPVTKADTDALFRAAGGKWSWNARPVWATVNGRTFAAALPAMPHAGSTIKDNGMDGHICLHFAETVANNKSYQADLRKAVQEAWDAAKR